MHGSTAPLQSGRPPGEADRSRGTLPRNLATAPCPPEGKSMPASRASDPRLTRALWAEARPIFDAILVHPFLRGLTDGGLGRERFAFYAVQDALYLGAF